MSKKTILMMLAFLCAVTGFMAANNILGTHIRTITVADGDAFYAEPSVTAASSTANFNVGDKLLVGEKLELKQPTAAVMKKSLLIEDKEKTKYKLEAGAAYKIADANLSKNTGKPDSLCVLEMKTTTGALVKLKVKKADVLPVDEGTWIKVRKKDSDREGWLRIKTQWY